MPTDNSYLSDKVFLRLNNLPDKKNITVLDCYQGRGLIWAWVKALSQKNIRTIGIEKRNLGFALPGDNIDYLASLDLSLFDAIDLDAYGVPFDQLDYVFSEGYQGIIYVTFIQSIFGGLPNKLYENLGYPPEMYTKAKTMFSKHGFAKFCQYLAMRGVKKISYRSHKRKYYLAFNCAEESEADLDIPQGERVEDHV